MRRERGCLARATRARSTRAPSSAAYHAHVEREPSSRAIALAGARWPRAPRDLRQQRRAVVRAPRAGSASTTRRGGARLGRARLLNATLTRARRTRLDPRPGESPNEWCGWRADARCSGRLGTSGCEAGARRQLQATLVGRRGAGRGSSAHPRGARERARLLGSRRQAENGKPVSFLCAPASRICRLRGRHFAGGPPWRHG
jgi:hypothetical protein